MHTQAPPLRLREFLHRTMQAVIPDVKSVDQIRRENLAALVVEFKTVNALAQRVEVAPSQLSDLAPVRRSP
jgi:hypothetical protein